jgi:hypothetical protein
VNDVHQIRTGSMVEFNKNKGVPKRQFRYTDADIQISLDNPVNCIFSVAPHMRSDRIKNFGNHVIQYTRMIKNVYKHQSSKLDSTQGKKILITGDIGMGFFIDYKGPGQNGKRTPAEKQKITDAYLKIISDTIKSGTNYDYIIYCSSNNNNLDYLLKNKSHDSDLFICDADMNKCYLGPSTFRCSVKNNQQMSRDSYDLYIKNNNNNYDKIKNLIENDYKNVTNICEYPNIVGGSKYPLDD